MSRTTRRDQAARRRMKIAALLFAGSMLAVGASIVWSIATAQGGEAGDAQSFTVCFLILVVLATTINMFVAYGRLRWFYRCPQCRAKVPRVPESEVGAKIRYRCAACDIDWDTGWYEISDSD